jgi:NAD(P)H dehydrogenase (quinone)
MVTRNPKALASFSALGVQVRHGDFDQPESLPAAFAGGEKMLLISVSATEMGRRLSLHTRAVEGAIAAGVRHVAYTSFTNPGNGNPSIAVAEHGESEGMLRHSGLAWSTLRDAIYADVEVPRAAAAVALGRWVTNRGDGGHGYVWRDDCAAAAAGLLAGGPEHEGKDYEITGPELVTVDEEAAMLTELTGRPVAVEQLDDDAWAEWIAAAGTAIEKARTRATSGQAIREGYFAIQTSAVEDLSGRAPRPLYEMFASRRGDILSPAHSS